MNNQNKISPAQKKAATRAFDKFKTDRKKPRFEEVTHIPLPIPTLKKIKAEWDSLSNLEKSKFVDRRLKVKPVWYEEKEEIKFIRVDANTCVKFYFGVVNSANNFFDNPENENHLENVSLDIPYYVSPRITRGSEIKVIDSNIDNFGRTVYRIKAGSHGRNQLYAAGYDGFLDYKARVISSINNRITKLTQDNNYYRREIADLSPRDDKSIRYNEYIDDNNRFINKYRRYIDQVTNILPGIEFSNIIPSEETLDKAADRIKRNYTDLIEREVNGIEQNLFLSFNKEELAIMGAYMLSVYDHENYDTKYIIITGVQPDFEYEAVDLQNTFDVIVKVSDVKKKFFADQENYYGYFPYVVPGIEEYKFNDGDNALCSITCLVFNPEFQKLVSDVDFNDESFRLYELYRLSGIIAYQSNLPFGITKMNFTQIRACHYSLAKYYNIKFAVQYYKYSKKTQLISSPIYTFEPNTTSVRLSKKNIKNMPILQTFIVKGHIFNVNDKESYNFLVSNVVKNIDELAFKSYEEVQGNNNALWGNVVHKYYMTESQSNPDITHSIVMNNKDFEHDNMNRTINVTIEVNKSGGRDSKFAMIARDNVIKSIPLDFKGYYPENNIPGNYKISGGEYRSQNSLYVSMDLETYMKGNVEIYSFSYCIFSNDKFGIKYRPVFKYSKTSITKDELEDEFIKIGEEADKRDYHRVIIFFHNGSRFDTILLSPHILKFKSLYNEKKGSTTSIFNPNLIDFSFCLLGINAKFSLRDSYRLLNYPVSALNNAYNLKLENGKLDYPYCFYQKIHQHNIINEFYTKQEMLDMITEDDFPNMSKSDLGISRVSNELMTYQNFVDTYFLDHEYFNPEEYCKVYNDQDVIIVREALLAAHKLYERLGDNYGKVGNIDCLNPTLLAVYTNDEIIYKRCETPNLLESITLSSFVGKIIKMQNVYHKDSDSILGDGVKYKTTINNGTHDFIKNTIQGGICYPAANKDMRLFISNQFEALAKSDLLYINPKDEELIQLFSKYGYNKYKTKPIKGSIDDQLTNLTKLSTEKGFGLACFDFTSLYPSAMYLQAMNSGEYNDMSESMFLNGTDKIYFACFTYDISMCDKVHVPYFNVFNADKVKVPIEEYPAGVIFLNSVQVDLFCKIYGKDKLKFINGFVFDYQTNALKELIGTLYAERCKYQKYESSPIQEEKEQFVLEGVLKNILNTIYGKMLTKEVTNEVCYWSSNFRPGILEYATEIVKAVVEADMYLMLEDKIYWNADDVSDDINKLLNYVNTLDIDSIYEFNRFYQACTSRRGKAKKGQGKSMEKFSICVSRHLHDMGFLNSTYSTEYDYNTYIMSGRIISDNPISYNEDCKSGYTNKVKLSQDKRKHENKLDWASLILAKSKELVYELCSKIGHDNIYYMDTDSVTCDGTYALQEDIKKGYKDRGLGTYKSDYSNKYSDGTKLKPINSEIGMESIFTVIISKKIYCNVLIGIHQDGYLTCMTKKRAKGVYGDAITIQEYINMHEGGEYVQNMCDTKAFCVTINKGLGLKDTVPVRTIASDFKRKEEKLEKSKN